MTLLLLFACTDKGDDTAPVDDTIALVDANDYAYTSAIDATTTEVGLGADFTLDWSGLDTDLLGHPMDPAADTDLVWIVQFPSLSQAEVLDKIVDDALLQEDVGPYVQYTNDGIDAVDCHLTDFIVPPATPIVPETDFTDGAGTWLLRITTGTLQNRMLMFMQPTDASTNHALSFTPDSATLTFEPDLQSLTPLSLAAGTPPTIDWSRLTTHANGNPLTLGALDTLFIARYDTLSLDDLEADFINVDTIASDVYTADVYGLTSADLSIATSATAGAFTGFTAGSVWLLALQCSLCTNPAPPFLTVVEVDG